MKKIKIISLVLMGSMLFFACSTNKESQAQSGTSSSEVVHTHNLVKHNSTTSTCVARGNSEYYECTECHKYFSDTNGEHEIEKDSWLLPLANHQLDEHAAHPADCKQEGNSLYYSCSVCGKYFSDNQGQNEINEDSWVLPTTEHELDWEHAVIVPSTATSEGSKTVTCKHCAYHVIYRMARLTELSLNGNSLEWNVVIDDTADENEATSYKIYVDNKLLDEVGPTVLTYDASLLATGEHKVEVVAMFDNENYIEGSGGSMDISVSVGAESVTRITDFAPVYNGVGFSFIEKDGQQVLKLNANNGANWAYNNYNVSTLYGVSLSFPAGKYRVQAEVMLGETSASQMFYYGSYGSSNGWFPGYRYIISLASCKTTEWTTITAEYTIDAEKTGQPEISFGSLSTALTENSYLLVRNARFIKVETQEENNVEYLNVFPREYRVNDWVNGNTIYNGKANQLIRLQHDQDGYEMFVYSEEANIAFTIAGASNRITSLGTYRMSLTLKLGPDASRIDNIGFRCIAQSGVQPWSGDNVFDLSPLSDATGYVTLTKYINIIDNSNTGWMNIDFWIFTHNNEDTSKDNYVLLKGVALEKINVNKVL